MSFGSDKLPSHRVIIAQVQARVDAQFAGRLAPRVLEAGCGSGSQLKCPVDAQVTGIDISEEQLARNATLQVKICADLQTYDFAATQFDLIVCWDVLEHLDHPGQALRRLFSVLAPGGMMVLALPNLYSLKGVVTKFTPYRFHVWFYRRVMKDASAREAFRQFPTYLRPAIGLGSLCRAARAAGLDVLQCTRYEGPVQADLRARRRVADFCFAVAGALGLVLSAGCFNPNCSDILLALQRPLGSSVPRDRLVAQ